MLPSDHSSQPVRSGRGGPRYEPKHRAQPAWPSSQTEGTSRFRIDGSGTADLCNVAAGKRGNLAGYYADCATSYVCIWEDPHFYTNKVQSAHIRDANYESHLGNRSYNGTGLSGQDNASSSFNAGQYNDPATIFQDASCAGYAFTMQANNGDSDYTNDSPKSGGGFDNQASSMSFSEYYGSRGNYACQAH